VLLGSVAATVLHALHAAHSCDSCTLFALLTLQDLGYTVDFSKAEPLVEPKARREARLLQQAAYIAAGGTDTGVRYLHNDIIDWPVKQHVPRHLR
jgi:SAM-dependent MidA family methyltransferase